MYCVKQYERGHATRLFCTPKLVDERLAYLATRNWLRLVPIWVNAVMIWLADVSR
jgi:hypothetical protein